MVIVEPESEGPQHISQMYWFFTESEIEEEDGKFFVEVDFPKNKWLTYQAEAYNWFMTSPNAAGVRAKGRNVRIDRLQNRLWEDTARGKDGEEEPEDWVATEVYDVSEDMDLEPDYTGVVTDRTLKFSFSVLVEADYSLFTVLSQFSAITTSMMSPADVLQLAGDRIIRHDMAYEIGTGDPMFRWSSRPPPGGVTTKVTELCKTCGHTGNINRANFCPGHFGRVPLESRSPTGCTSRGHPTLSSHSLPQAHLRLLQPHHSTFRHH